MKLLIAISISLLSVMQAFAQAPCKSPKNNYGIAEASTAIKTFALKNEGIGLFGKVDTLLNEPVYSSFILVQCSKKAIINYWDITQKHKVEVEKDTLYVKEQKYLPTGQSQSYVLNDWHIEKIYLNKKGEIEKTKLLNKGIRKYNQQEIDKAITAYNKASNELRNNTLTLANRLFVATISGSKQAEDLFIAFKTKFAMDGPVTKGYNELTSMLAEWKSTN